MRAPYLSGIAILSSVVGGVLALVSSDIREAVWAFNAALWAACCFIGDMDRLGESA